MKSHEAEKILDDVNYKFKALLGLGMGLYEKDEDLDQETLINLATLLENASDAIRRDQKL